MTVSKNKLIILEKVNDLKGKWKFERDMAEQREKHAQEAGNTIQTALEKGKAAAYRECREQFIQLIKAIQPLSGNL